ncbi:DUF5681 domain-containing protein [Sphingomonas sp. ERG5]|uniref:DUF5681 domain-containing protein n=1 Tax=Sphingomonas sp. ERG5 TaxID=1381597 RepID=UPI00126A561C|nr:DUF5681 domain-containing protein [Sphingomonas sp. ERG5]
MNEWIVESRAEDGVTDAAREGVPIVAARATKGRFIKGKSGNPAGRPRLRGATGRKGDRLPGSDLPTRAMILEEAYRRVSACDGSIVGREEAEMPANRAVFRAMTMAAVQGNRLAQRQWTSLVQRAEEAQKQEQVALFRALEQDGVETRYSLRLGDYVPVGDFDDEILADLDKGISIVRALRNGDDGSTGGAA